MATLRDIRRRIRSVESTQKITRAMKLVAAAKLRRAQERILAARPYAEKMAELMSSLVARVDAAQHPLLARRPGGRRRLVVITADKGLCGAFNSNVLRAAVQYLRAALLPRHVTTQVFRALMESAAGEFGARMTAMEAATKNAKEMIDLLTIQYNKARQERITKELLDIVGGAEALRQAVEA